MMTRRYIFAVLLLAPCFWLPVSAQESNDEVGIWSEIGIEKAITKNWDVGLDMEYRAQNKARLSVGLGTSYKVNKYLKFGLNYSFLYSEKNKYKVKEEGEIGSDVWTRGYNLIDEWYPRHRFSAEATGSIKLWNWLKVSLRERYQLTHCKTRNIEKYVYREVWGMAPRFEEGEDEWDVPLTYAVNTLSGDDLLKTAYKLQKNESITGDIVYQVPTDSDYYIFSYLEQFSDDTEGDLFAVYFGLEE